MPDETNAARAATGTARIGQSRFLEPPWGRSADGKGVWGCRGRRLAAAVPALTTKKPRTLAELF